MGGNPYAAPTAQYGAPAFTGYKPSSDTATWALIMAIVSWFTCGCLLSIPAIFMARSELDAIKRGEVSQSNEGLATAAFWIAVINAVVTLLGVGFYVLVIAGAIATNGYR